MKVQFDRDFSNYQKYIYKSAYSLAGKTKFERSPSSFLYRRNLGLDTINLDTILLTKPSFVSLFPTFRLIQ